MTLSLVQAIHQRWAESPALCSLLPVARVSTGMSADPALPRAVVHKESDRPLLSCNDGSEVALVTVRIRVFHDDYAAAAATIGQLKAALERAEFALECGGKVLDVRRSNDSEQQLENGVWEMTIDFDCTVHLPAPIQ